MQSHSWLRTLTDLSLVRKWKNKFFSSDHHMTLFLKYVQTWDRQVRVRHVVFLREEQKNPLFSCTSWRLEAVKMVFLSLSSDHSLACALLPSCYSLSLFTDFQQTSSFIKAQPNTESSDATAGVIHNEFLDVWKLPVFPANTEEQKAVRDEAMRETFSILSLSV